jgi:hypothetical protein
MPPMRFVMNNAWRTIALTRRQRLGRRLPRFSRPASKAHKVIILRDTPRHSTPHHATAGPGLSMGLGLLLCSAVACALLLWYPLTVPVFGLEP